MKTLYFAFLFCLANIASAKNLSSLGRYKSVYQDGLGRAEMTMTGTPGVVLITKDSNHCQQTDGKINYCNLAAIGGDVYNMPFRLRKIKESKDLLTYIADYIAPENLQGYNETYFEEIAKIQIIITVPLNSSNIIGGNDELVRVKNLQMQFVGEKSYSLLGN